MYRFDGKDKMFLNKKEDFLDCNNLNLQCIYFKSILKINYVETLDFI